VTPGAIRFHPARTYLTLAAIALGLAVFSGWWTRLWLPAAIPAALFLATGALALWLALRPVIEVSEEGLRIGDEFIAWRDIRRVDQTGWVAPLVADLTLTGKRRIRLIYPGETTNSNRLLRLIQQNSTQALINGVPWRQIFGDPAPAQRAQPPAQRPRLLREEDEAEVERLYQKLRSAGRLDPEK
ncbi:MAG: DUF3093 family protein, partial [Bryobacteraceae bacterium]|nr:DUF3093 family protein [Bryobacteraceae bacterium]